MLNFNWWVNRKDPEGRNVFAGGFLGLDNIGVFDRSAPLPTGGTLEQADGTAWMAFYCQNMLEIALILADHDPIYEEAAFKFLRHFMWIAYAMDRIGENHDEMWDEDDGFFYDILRLPDGSATRLKVRSMVGLLPLCASTIFEPDDLDRHPRLLELVKLYRERHPDVVARWRRARRGSSATPGAGCSRRSRRSGWRASSATCSTRTSSSSPYGIRSLSRYHQDHPFVFHVGGQRRTASRTCRLNRTPGCSAATRTGAARSGCRSTR